MVTLKAWPKIASLGLMGTLIIGGGAHTGLAGPLSAEDIVQVFLEVAGVLGVEIRNSEVKTGGLEAIRANGGRETGGTK